LRLWSGCAIPRIHILVDVKVLSKEVDLIRTKAQHCLEVVLQIILLMFLWRKLRSLMK